MVYFDVTIFSTKMSNKDIVEVEEQRVYNKFNDRKNTGHLHLRRLRFACISSDMYIHG